MTKEMGLDKINPIHKNLAMTRMVDCPAVLVECGFVSNPAEYEWLISSETQRRLGVAAGKAVEEYFMSSLGGNRPDPGSQGQQTSEREEAPKPILYPDPSGKIRVLVNGSDIPMDQTPVIQNNRTLVPMRAILESLSAEVGWNDESRTVTSTKGAISLSLVIGSSEMSLFNAEEPGKVTKITLEAPAQIMGDRTMIPVRAVSESLSAKVDWDEYARAVLIEK